MKSLHDFNTMCFAVKGRNNGHQVYEKMELHMQVCPLFPIHNSDNTGNVLRKHTNHQKTRPENKDISVSFKMDFSYTLSSLIQVTGFLFLS